MSQQGLRKHTPFKLSDDDSPKLQVQFPQVQFCSIFVRFLAKSVSSNAKKKNNSTIQHFLLVTGDNSLILRDYKTEEMTTTQHTNKRATLSARHICFIPTHNHKPKPITHEIFQTIFHIFTASGSLFNFCVSLNNK